MELTKVTFSETWLYSVPATSIMRGSKPLHSFSIATKLANTSSVLTLSKSLLNVLTLWYFSEPLKMKIGSSFSMTLALATISFTNQAAFSLFQTSAEAEPHLPFKIPLAKML